MSGNEPLTLASVRDYMLKNDGKVKNHDLVTHFRQQLNDPANKNKIRGDFKDIVHQLATVQEINGEKYFVLKKPKEAPAVLRKPTGKPPRPHPSSHKARPVSGPPVMRNAKLFEDMLSTQMSKGHPPGSVGHVAEFDKENRADVKGLAREHMRMAGSVDSLDSTGSTSSTPKTSRKVSSNKGKDNEDRISQISGDDLPEDGEFEVDDDSLPAIHLEPLEKEWILTAARGNRANIMCLLEQEPSLANKKDFTSGYTALHWAAKHGREDIVAMLAKTGIDVNIKSHGGYTPLHLASMQGHDKVIKVLVDECGANIDIRDNSGRKPRQVARNTLTIEAHELLIHVPSAGVASSDDRKTSVSKKKHSTSKQQYGSINSIITPSAALVGFYGGDKPVQPMEPTPDKSRDRASSFGKFLKKDKKKHKKDQRASTVDVPPPPEYTTSFAGFLIGSPQQLQQVENERRENEMGLHRSHSDSDFRMTSEI